MDEPAVISIASKEDILPEKLGPSAREVWKPDISGLADAVVNGKLIVPVNKEIVIQYPEPWRETSLMKIVKIYDETYPVETIECEVIEKNETVKRKFTCVKDTTVQVGHVTMWDMEKGQFAATNYIAAKSCGLVLKIWVGGKEPK